MSSNPQPNPYAPPKAEVSDAQDAQVVQPASRLRRLGAALVDAAIGGVVSLPLLTVAMPYIVDVLINPTAPPAPMSRLLFGGAGLLTFVLSVTLLIVTIVLVKRNQQTIGKKLLGIKVARSDGSPATLGRIFWLRNVVNFFPGFIPILGMFYGLVDHLFIFGDKRQCIHDKIADTIVVKA